MNQDDLNADLLKWETMSNDSKRTSDIDPSELDKYQVCWITTSLNNISLQYFVEKQRTKENKNIQLKIP